MSRVLWNLRARSNITQGQSIKEILIKKVIFELIPDDGLKHNRERKTKAFLIEKATYTKAERHSIRQSSLRESESQ